MSHRCSYCGARATRWHHLTGRDQHGRYLDPTLRVPVCHDHHELVHDDWRLLGIQDPEPGHKNDVRLTLVEGVELRLRRFACNLSRPAEPMPAMECLAPLAACTKCWADDLARDVNARDERDPGWRSDDHFYPPAAYVTIGRPGGQHFVYHATRVTTG